MQDNTKDLYYLNELSDYKVADGCPDVRGWEVKDAGNRTVGKVDNLLVSKKDKKVVYLDVEVDKSVVEDGYKSNTEPAVGGGPGFLNNYGQDHLIIPIQTAEFDEDHKHVSTSNVDYDTFTAARRFKRGAPKKMDNDQQLFPWQNEPQ